jgi:hypothetical protein
MQAPAPNPVRLAVDRTRCSCGAETLVFYAESWYHGQESRVYTPPCAACGKPLVEIAVPMGTQTEAYELSVAPRALAARVADGRALVDEIDAVRDPELPEMQEAPLAVERWFVPHEAPEAYITWKADQPVPEGFFDKALLREAGISLGIVAVYVVFCILV